MQTPFSEASPGSWKLLCSQSHRLSLWSGRISPPRQGSELTAASSSELAGIETYAPRGHSSLAFAAAHLPQAKRNVALGPRVTPDTAAGPKSFISQAASPRCNHPRVHICAESKGVGKRKNEANNCSLAPGSRFRRPGRGRCRRCSARARLLRTWALLQPPLTMPPRRCHPDTPPSCSRR